VAAAAAWIWVRYRSQRPTFYDVLSSTTKSEVIALAGLADYRLANVDCLLYVENHDVLLFIRV